MIIGYYFLKSKILMTIFFVSLFNYLALSPRIVLATALINNSNKIIDSEPVIIDRWYYWEIILLFLIIFYLIYRHLRNRHQK